MRLIDADALIEDAKEQCEVLTIFTSGNEEMDEIAKILLKGLIYQTKKTPTVDPVKHGRWLPVKLLDDEADFGEVDGAQCSECGYAHESEYWAKTYFNYCPNCGAKMDEEG